LIPPSLISKPDEVDEISESPRELVKIEVLIQKCAFNKLPGDSLAVEA